MSIRQRFLVMFLSLVSFGVITISIFSLIFVRDHLLRTSRDNLDQQAQYLATLLLASNDTSQYEDVLKQFVLYGNYRAELVDEQFTPILSAGTLADSSGHTFLGIAPLAAAATQDRQYVRVIASEDAIRATLQKVRSIIYVGIFITLVLTAIASWVVADKLTQPVRSLAAAARKIADGEPANLAETDREDEIGDLARDVDAMAQRLQDDIADLRDLNQTQEDFIAALSHEVRNPIFSARGYLEMAIEDKGLKSDDEPLDKVAMRELLEKAHRNLLRIHTLFADMLMLVRLEFGDEPVQLGSIPIGAVVGELEETFLPLARERSIALVVKADDLAVNGQKELIKIVLSNLLSNAIRHTEKGEVRLDVSAHDGKARFMVVDSGVGIDEEHLQRIFDKFYRVDKSRSRDEGGTGLGLAIVQQCMTTLNSKIEVTSEVGNGSKFWFELPLA